MPLDLSRINVGTTAGDGTGDKWRDAWQKLNGWASAIEEEFAGLSIEESDPIAMAALTAHSAAADPHPQYLTNARGDTRYQGQIDGKQPLHPHLTAISGLTAANGALVLGNGTTFGTLAGGTNGKILTMAGGVPVWATPALNIEATSEEAKAGTGSTQLMTPRRVAEASRVVERFGITGDLSGGSVFGLAVNAGGATRVVTRVAWVVTQALIGEVKPHYWVLQRGSWSGAAFALDGAAHALQLANRSTSPAEWTGLEYSWPSGSQLRIEYADLSGSGSYMTVQQAEMEIEWRAA